jgi:hypothetical protein
MPKFFLFLLLTALSATQAFALSATNSYYVFGGNTSIEIGGSLASCLNPMGNGFTFIGTSDVPQTFTEQYNYYVITNFDNRTYTYLSDPNMKAVYIDALEWSDGAYLTGSWGSSNTPNYANLTGAPDKKFLTLGSSTAGGCIQVPKPNNSTSLRIISAVSTDVIIPTLNIKDVTTNSFTVVRPEAINATSYWLTVATDAAFTQTLAGYNSKEITSNENSIISGLDQNTQYYIRIVAADDAFTNQGTYSIKTSLAKSGIYYVYGAPTPQSGQYPTYELIGEGSSQKSFSGNYQYYKITSGQSAQLDCNEIPSMVFIDAVKWSDGTYVGTTPASARVYDAAYATGAPDGKYAVLGQYENAQSGNFSCGGLVVSRPNDTITGLTVLPYGTAPSAITATTTLLLDN